MNGFGISKTFCASRDCRLASAFSGVSLMMNDGKLGVIGMATHDIEKRLAHFEGGTIKHERIRILLEKQFADTGGKAGDKDFVAMVSAAQSSEARRSPECRR